jgi:hypothetical protein
MLIPMIVSGILGGLVGASMKVNRNALAFRIFEQLLALNQIFVMPLMSIVPALLFIKMKQLSGESLSASLAQIEEGEGERSNWQQRMRTRLSLQTPTGQKTTTGG